MDACRGVATLALASRPRQGVAGVKRKEARESKERKPESKGKRIGRVRAKRRKPGSHHILPGVITYSRESKEVRGSVRE